jgi:hypothetical protein
MSVLHRVKSFFITLGSLVAAALGAIAVTNPGAIAAVLTDVQAWLDGFGVWASLSTLVGLLLSEVVRHFVNKRKIAQANKEGLSSSTARSLELY